MLWFALLACFSYTCIREGFRPAPSRVAAGAALYGYPCFVMAVSVESRRPVNGREGPYHTRSVYNPLLYVYVLLVSSFSDDVFFNTCGKKYGLLIWRGKWNISTDREQTKREIYILPENLLLCFGLDPDSLFILRWCEGEIGGGRYTRATREAHPGQSKADPKRHTLFLYSIFEFFQI